MTKGRLVGAAGRVGISLVVVVEILVCDFTWCGAGEGSESCVEVVRFLFFE